MKKYIQKIAFAALATLMSMSVFAGSLVIESWRTDDKALWENVLIPAFNKTHPDITVSFKGTNSTDYDAAMTKGLGDGSAGDLITCRPFDTSLRLYEQDFLTQLDSLDGMLSFPDSAKVAWQTDSGEETYCLPMASVIHGFFYNKKIFSDLGLKVPETVNDFTAVLEAVKYAPNQCISLSNCVWFG